MKPGAAIILLLLFVCGNISGQACHQALRPAWVTPVSYDYSKEITQGTISEGYYYFLADRQVDVKTKTYYNHHAVKLFNSDGVDSESKLYLNYNPLYETLKIHSVRIHRGGQSIDKLKDARCSELQREEELENNVYKGKTTLSLILSDVRVGDIIEYEYSVTGDNPIFNNKFSYSFYLNGYYDSKVRFYKIRHDVATPIYIRYTNDSVSPVITFSGSTRELVWDLKDVKGLRTEASMPGSYEAYNLAEISEYQSWAEVAQWGIRVFSTDNTEIRELINFIKNLDSIPQLEKKIISCLRYTQDNIRYFGIEIGENSHRPKNVSKIVRDGYGDCKDKTMLFCYLLRRIGVTAFPVLVNSQAREGVYQSIPSPTQFDHVITMVALNGKSYFFDPTISSQRGDLTTTYFPEYGCGLALTDTTRYLTRLRHTGIFDVNVTEIFTMKNMKGDGALEVSSVYKGYDADDIRQWISTSNTEEIRKSYKNFYEKKFGELDTTQVLRLKDEAANNTYYVTEKYGIHNIWSQYSTDEQSKAEFNAHIIVDMVNKINIEAKTRRYPLSLDYPTLKTHEIIIHLPEEWSVTISRDVIENEFITFHYSSAYMGKTIQLKYSLEIKKPFVPAEKYASFKKDVEKIKNSLNYAISHNKELSKKIKAAKYNWSAGSFAILFAVLCLLLFLYCLRFFKRNPNNETPPAGIGGWLVLPYLGLLVLPFRSLYILFFTYYFDNEYWISHTDEASSDYKPGYEVFMYYLICYQIVLFFFSFFAFIQFTRKHHKVPALMVGFYIFTFVCQNMSSYFISYYTNSVFSGSHITRIVQAAIPFLIWLPYFMFSKRVKKTFVV